MPELTPTETKILTIMKNITSHFPLAEFFAINGINQGELEAIRSGLIKRNLLTVTGKITPDGIAALEKGN